MSFMSKFSAVALVSSRARAEGPSPRRRRAPLRLEALEARDLKTVAGVSLVYGMVSIEGPNSSGNSAHVSRVGDSVRVSLNGQEVDFNSSEVSSVSYTGGANGGDTFENDTNLYSQAYGFGGHNNFSGGSYFNTVYLHGDDNKYDARGGTSYVFAYDGPHNSIVQYSNNYVYAYNTSSYYSYFF